MELKIFGILWCLLAEITNSRSHFYHNTEHGGTFNAEFQPFGNNNGGYLNNWNHFSNFHDASFNRFWNTHVINSQPNQYNPFYHPSPFHHPHSIHNFQPIHQPFPNTFFNHPHNPIQPYPVYENRIKPHDPSILTNTPNETPSILSGPTSISTYEPTYITIPEINTTPSNTPSAIAVVPPAENNVFNATPSNISTSIVPEIEEYSTTPLPLLDPINDFRSTFFQTTTTTVSPPTVIQSTEYLPTSTISPIYEISPKNILPASEPTLLSLPTTTLSSVISESSNEIDSNEPTQLFDNINCGSINLTPANFIGNDTKLDEFPWIVLLQYRNSTNGRSNIKCSSVLINKRYVLTAGHCIKGALISVRLGEYNLNTNPDCITSDTNNSVCADEVVEIPVEEIIPNYEYNVNNDIALIRLSKKVEYTEYIKPICVPWKAINSSPGDTVIVAGWGQTLSENRSSVKEKTKIYIANKSYCVSLYKNNNITITEKQLCAGGNDFEDACYGDIGGALMVYRERKWYVEGITSFGYACRSVGWPGIYTRVNAFLDWIRDNVKN